MLLRSFDDDVRRGNELFSEGTTKRRLTNIEKRSKETASAPRETTTQEMPSSDWRSSTVQPATLRALEVAEGDLVEDVYFNLGNAYFREGRFDDAIGAYREVLLLDPDDLDAKVNLELALLAQVSEASSGTPAGEDGQQVPESGLGGEETTARPRSGQQQGEGEQGAADELNSAWTMPWAMPERAIY